MIQTDTNPDILTALVTDLQLNTPTRRTSASQTLDEVIDDLMDRGCSCTKPRRFTGPEIATLVHGFNAIADAVRGTGLSLNMAQYGRGFYLLSHVRPGDDEAVQARRAACALLANLADDHLMDNDHVWTIAVDVRYLSSVLALAADRLTGDATLVDLVAHLRREASELLASAA